MLLNTFQTSKFLSVDAFKAHGTSGHLRRMWLSSTHAVQAKLGERDRGGQALVWYGIEVDDRHCDPTHDLTISRYVPPVGSQSMSGAIDVLSEMGARMMVAGNNGATLSFDFRALAYVCGFVAGAASVGNKVSLPERASVAPLSTAHTLHMSSAPIVPGTLYTNGHELATLLRLFKAAGSDTITVTDQSVDPRGSTLTGESLGVYCLRVYANILAEAATVSAAATHVEAYFSGLSAVYRVLGHSYEGGGLRRALRTRSYPAPCGLITTRMTTVGLLPTHGLVKRSELIRYNVALVLECTGRLSRCDPSRVKGMPTIYQTDESGKPSSLVGFRNDLYSLMREWRKKTVEEMALVLDSTIDTCTFRDYFEKDEVDRHYMQKYVVPFYVIEPGPVSMSLDSNIGMLGCQGQGVTVPLLPGAVGYKTAAYQEFKGRTFPGSVAKLVMTGGYHARSAGINYLMSGRYSMDNGLSQFMVSTAPQLGCHSNRLAMADNSASNLADARWHTYHNPLPNPAESFTNLPLALDFTYQGNVNEASISELVNGEVDSMFGPLIVGSAPAEKSTYHRDVPDELASLVSETSGTTWFLASKSGVIDPATLIEPDEIKVTPSPFSLPPLPNNSLEIEGTSEDIGEEMKDGDLGEASDDGKLEPNPIDPASNTVKPKSESDGGAGER